MNLSDQTIGEKIKQYRKGKMTQQELAEKIGKTESSIRKYEKGIVTIPLDVLDKIASALDVSAFDLLGVEYWDRKYPSIAQESKEYEGFVDYLNCLGYSILSVEKTSSNSERPSYEIEFLKDGQITKMDELEFKQLQSYTKDIIALKLWQKSQENK